MRIRDGPRSKKLNNPYGVAHYGVPAKAPFSFRGERRSSGVSAIRLKKVGASDT